MNKEEEIRIAILKEATAGNPMLYHKDPISARIALELVRDDFLVGEEDEYGFVAITAIREKGLKYLDSTRPIKKAVAVTRKVLDWPTKRVGNYCEGRPDARWARRNDRAVQSRLPHL